MLLVSLRHIDKVYDNGVQAVFDFTLDIDQHEFIVSVAELLGHEYYVHTDMCGADFIAKIPLTRPISNGDKMRILFDTKKAHIFDPDTENRIF